MKAIQWRTSTASYLVRYPNAQSSSLSATCNLEPTNKWWNWNAGLGPRNELLDSSIWVFSSPNLIETKDLFALGQCIGNCNQNLMVTALDIYLLMLTVCKRHISRHMVASCISPKSAESSSAVYAFFFSYSYKGDFFMKVKVNRTLPMFK
jgi:hypothetical protein